MRQFSVARMKNKNQLFNEIPNEGTKCRKLYDLFISNKGKIINVSATIYPKTMIVYFIDFYGWDIRRVGKCKWILAGEWYGKVYVDYIAENMEK